MLVRASFLTKVLAASLMMPPPVPQEQVNCSAPVYASDMLVCADHELLALDRRTAKLSASAGEERLAAGGLEPQPVWFRKRSLCAMQVKHRECLVEAYRMRIRALRALR